MAIPATRRVTDIFLPLLAAGRTGCWRDLIRGAKFENVNFP